MSTKNTTQVLIAGKIVTICGYESEEYLQKVATYLNNKISELTELPGYNRQPVDTKNTLLSLNITDDYFKAKKQAEILEEDLQMKDREMYDLKHELIALQVQLENAKKEIERMKQEQLAMKNKSSQLEMNVKDLLK
ncbi:MAG: cell division protein ZapA [Lachnospiraceae bacterium]|nr:cell division protein ZapA [Lachnospiraceae bacterium]MDD3614965.1 cell division protein ZapA [Lachnospiraceae bacterium]